MFSHIKFLPLVDDSDMVMRTAPAPDRLRTLAWLLGMPEQDALSALVELAQTNPWLEQATEQLMTIPLAHWQAEHTRLFISGYPKTVCPPFESAYRHGRMDGPARMELDNLYRQVGLAPLEVPADYLGTLLEFAAYLSEQSPAHETVMSTLWDEHLRIWLPRFRRDLIQHSRLTLYCALSEQLAEVIQ